MSIPLFDTRATKEDKEAIDAVVDSGSYIGGTEVRLLEEEICEYLGVRNCVTVANGTDALTLMLRAAFPFGLMEWYARGQHPWFLDESRPPFITTTPYTFGATVESIFNANLIPRFSDIGDDYNMNVIGAALAVHLFGNMADIDCDDFEDACQAFGAEDKDGYKAGSLGRAAAFSFFPTKPLGCMGDGGCVTTNDDDLAAQVRLLANHGMTSKFHHEVVGVNSRLDAMQAAVLRVRLRRIDRDNEHRREAAAYYDEHLSELVATPLTRGRPTYHLYIVRHNRASECVDALHAAGVGSGIYYPEPLHTQPAFSRYATGPLPVVESVAGKTFALPCHQNITRAEQDEVIAVLRQVLG